MMPPAQVSHLDRLNTFSRPLASRLRQAGFNMVEGLVALLVMGVGIVGIAALYSDQVHTNPESELREQASRLAEQMAARIRETKEGLVGFAGTVGVLCNAKSPPRTAQDAAAREAACWEDEVERQLPSGQGTVTRDLSTHPETYVVAVSWSSPETGAATYVLRVSPESSRGP
jgi:type IV pilus assembly protein PilV